MIGCSGDDHLKAFSPPLSCRTSLHHPTHIAMHKEHGHKDDECTQAYGGGRVP